MLKARPGRPVIAAALVACCAVLGLSAPLVFDFKASEFRLSNVAVFAAARGGHDIAVPVDIAPALRIRLERGSIALNAADRSAGSEADVVPADGSAELIIDGGEFQIAGPQDQAQAGDAGPAAPLIKALRALNFDTVVIRQGTVRLALPDGRIETLTNVLAEVRRDGRSSIGARGTARFRGHEFSFDLSAPATANASAVAGVPMKLRIKSPLMDVAFDGGIGASDRLHLHGRIEFAVPNVRSAARSFGAPWPDGPGLRDVAIKGDFHWQSPALTFDKASFRMDGNEATGTLALSFAGERPALTGTLALQSLSLAPYLSPDGATDNSFSSFLAWARSDRSELSAPMARYFDADVRLSAGQLVAGGTTFGRFAASLSLKRGRLLADIAEIDLTGGRGSGQITADLAGTLPQISVRGKLEDIDAARASMALMGHSAVQGLSTVSMDLTAEGNSLSELLSGVRGKIALNVYEGGRLGIDIRALLDAAQKGALEGWAVGRGQTSVEGLQAKLRVDKGILASELVEATAGNSLLRAFGTISLQSRQMDLRLLLDGLRDSKPDVAGDVLVFRGPWTSPSITLQR
jgi:AsmA protein